MKKRIYTDDEIEKLKKCIFVKDIKRKCEIEYDSLFKLWTIMMKYEFPELTAREIFNRAGFDIDILNNKLPQRRIKEWKDNYIKFGVSYFFPEQGFYYSNINRLKESTKEDDMRKNIMNFVLSRLENYDNR